jgi:hypothetical protein
MNLTQRLLSPKHIYKKNAFLSKRENKKRKNNWHKVRKTLHISGAGNYIKTFELLGEY